MAYLVSLHDLLGSVAVAHGVVEPLEVPDAPGDLVPQLPGEPELAGHLGHVAVSLSSPCLSADGGD